MKRSNLNFYDESGFSPEELFLASNPYLAQDSDFELGKENVNQTDLFSPKNIPNQKILASSASSIETYFYQTYKEYATQMFLGNKDYFVADIDCSFPLKPTFNGIDFKPLVTQEQIDSELRINSEKALREYYNKFTRDGGDKQAIKRATIVKNCENYLPEYNNCDNKTKYLLAYDPARSYDNSVVTVAKLIFDEEVGYKLRIVDCVSLADSLKKKHTPINTPSQIEEIKKMILNYNGKQVADYENIEAILIDSGAGGGGKIIGDFFIDQWIDNRGVSHRGLIDTEEYAELLYLYPDTEPKIKLIEPTKWKTKMYDSLVEMLGLGLIEFTSEYNGKDFVFLQDGKEEKTVMLSQDQKESYIQIDLMKEELVNMYRYTGSNGSHRYSLSPEKEGKLHDDRSYTCALLGWYLQQLRRDNIVNPEREKANDMDLLAAFASLF